MKEVIPHRVNKYYQNMMIKILSTISNIHTTHLVQLRKKLDQNAGSKFTTAQTAQTHPAKMPAKRLQILLIGNTHLLSKGSLSTCSIQYQQIRYEDKDILVSCVFAEAITSRYEIHKPFSWNMTFGSRTTHTWDHRKRESGSWYASILLLFSMKWFSIIVFKLLIRYESINVHM